METEDLTLDENTETEEDLDNPANEYREHGMMRIQTVLKNNPEIPDALRDLAPFLSRDMRQGVVKLAAIGDFMLRMVDNSTFGINSTNDRQPIGELYGTMKKYIPMNKRQEIDAVMGAIDMLKIKMKPKPAANELENIINGLTRVNEMSKLISGASAVKELAGTLTSKEKRTDVDINGMMDIIGNLVGKDKMEQLTGMLGKMIGESN